MQIFRNIQSDSAQAIAISTNVFDQMIEETMARDDEIVVEARRVRPQSSKSFIRSIPAASIRPFSITRNSGARVLKEFLPFSTDFECF
jgi:hypothetical protein